MEGWKDGLFEESDLPTVIFSVHPIIAFPILDAALPAGRVQVPSAGKAAYDKYYSTLNAI